MVPKTKYEGTQIYYFVVVNKILRTIRTAFLHSSYDPFPVVCANSILVFAKLKYVLSSSIPINRLFKFTAATPVVPDPIQQSSTILFSLEYVLIMYSISSNGFWVGCPPLIL